MIAMHVKVTLKEFEVVKVKSRQWWKFWEPQIVTEVQSKTFEEVKNSAFDSLDRAQASTYNDLHWVLSLAGNSFEDSSSWMPVVAQHIKDNAKIKIDMRRGVTIREIEIEVV